MGLLRGIDYSDPPVLYRGERILALVRKLAATATEMPEILDTEFAASVYYALFLPAPILEPPSPQGEPRKRMLQRLLLSSLLASPRFARIRQHTIADLTASTVASAVFLEALLKELEHKLPRPDAGGASAREGAPEGKEANAREDEDELKRSVEKALDAALDAARQAKEISRFAMSFSAGSASILTLEDSIQDVVSLARNTDVKTLLEALKTIEDTETYIKRRIMRSPRGELDGYEKGSDLERLVPSELVLPTEYFLVKYAERSLLLYRKVVRQDYGPFYVLLDKSGSMMGMKMIWAKAVALALAQRAARERREFFLRFFDSIPYPPLHISKRIHGRDVVKLLEYVARVRANGGTDISRAILTAVEDIASVRSGKKPSDIVLITDGEDKISVELIRRSLAKVDARLYTIMIYGNNPDLRRVSESYMVATKLSREEALKVVMVGS